LYKYLFKFVRKQFYYSSSKTLYVLYLQSIFLKKFKKLLSIVPQGDYTARCLTSVLVTTPATTWRCSTASQMVQHSRFQLCPPDRISLLIPWRNRTWT